ncbi:hypothetical protein HY636_02555 [Candidatus Woesearchaeota archaeon]|nr:hypothetical protein [Candidatus Woesearchaeota archaeon]
MKINELQVKQGKVELTATVKEKGDVREFNKFGKIGRVCNAVIEDETGAVTLTLWNEQVEMVNVGDTIQIENGYVGEYQGEKQLTTGKFGKLTVINGNTPNTNMNLLNTNTTTYPSSQKQKEPITSPTKKETQKTENYNIKVDEEFID